MLELREASGMTREELAVTSQVREEVVSDLESGRRKHVEKEMARRVAAAL